MLTGGFYAGIDLSYDAVIAQEKNGRPFSISALRPIQLIKRDVLDAFYEGRKKFTTEEWKQFLLRSIGLEPSSMTERNSDVLILRMVPFVENNYNMVELGPRGTGKSHLLPANIALCPSGLWRQGYSCPDVRQQEHRPARSGLPVRRRLLR